MFPLSGFGRLSRSMLAEAKRYDGISTSRPVHPTRKQNTNKRTAPSSLQVSELHRRLGLCCLSAVTFALCSSLQCTYSSPTILLSEEHKKRTKGGTSSGVVEKQQRSERARAAELFIKFPNGQYLTSALQVDHLLHDRDMDGWK